MPKTVADRLAQYSPVTLTAPLDKLTPGVRASLPHLARALRALDVVYQRQLGDQVVDLCGGEDFICVAREGGDVLCWGSNDHGQLGAGGSESSAVPLPVLGITDAVALDCGGYHACARHASGGMDNPTRKQYREFLLSSWADTALYEFRLAGHLLAVAVTDHLVDGLSAVYTFFDPDFSRRALGTYCVVWQIEETRRLGLEWLYLGYWIAKSPKMLYKQEFQPQERFIDGRWRLCQR